MEHVDMLMGVILPYANFFIFLGLAIYFFRKPATAAAKKKKDDFDRAAQEAAAARDAAVVRLDELKRRQAGLDKEVADLRSMSSQAGESESQKIMADAERFAQHLREEASRIANAEVTKARAVLRHEIVEAVRDGVTQKMKTELGADQHLSLVKKQIGELKNIQAEG